LVIYQYRMFSKKFFLLLIIVIAIAGFLVVKEVRRARGIVTEQQDVPLLAYEITPIPADSSDAPYGNPGAPITIFEFSNLGCDSCREIHEDITSFIRSHPQDIRLIWRYAPNRGWFSGNYELAHQAAFCAGKQGKFWEFTDAAIQDKDNLEEPGLSQMASSLRLNMPAWRMCMASDEAAQKMSEWSAIAKAFDINSAPTIFVNNRRVHLDKNINMEEMMKRMVEK